MKCFYSKSVGSKEQLTNWR